MSSPAISSSQRVCEVEAVPCHDASQARFFFLHFFPTSFFFFFFCVANGEAVACHTPARQDIVPPVLHRELFFFLFFFLIFLFQLLTYYHFSPAAYTLSYDASTLRYMCMLTCSCIPSRIMRILSHILLQRVDTMLQLLKY
jgi:hypothetical protein